MKSEETNPRWGKFTYKNVPPQRLGGILLVPWTPFGWISAGLRIVNFFPLLISFSLLLPSFILLFLFLLEDSGKTYTNCHAECVVNKNS